MTWFTVNAYPVFSESYTYPLYLECDNRETAEHIVRRLGLRIDDAGVSEVICAVPDRRSN